MEDGSPPKYGTTATLIPVGLCIIAGIAQLSSGMTMGFSAVTLPYMQQKESYISITSDEASWFASLAAISIPIGCLISGPILDRWGRKTGLLLVNLPSFVGWLLIGIQPNMTRIYIGRVLTGLASGLSSVPATVYFAEISTKSVRGLLINGTSVSISCGVLIVYVLGHFLKEDWRMVASICSVFPLTATVLIAVLVPESPQWLISKGCHKKASKSLKAIRGVSNSKDIQEEFDSMLDQANLNRRHKITIRETALSFTKPQVYKPFFIMNLFFFFQQFSGIFVVIFYAVDMVSNSGITTDPFIVSIMIAIIRLLFTILGAGLSKQLGRRPLAILSGVGMTLSLFVLIYNLSYQSDPPVLDSNINKTGLVSNLNSSITDDVAFDASAISWTPLIAMLLYVLSSTIGFLTLPWAMIGEVFPSEIRGVAGGLTTCFAYIASFAIVKSYPYLLTVLKQSGVYMIFGIVALIGTVFVIIFLPETQGKTLKEIETYFINKGKTSARSEDDDAPENKIMLSSVKKPEIVPQVLITKT